MYLLYLRAASCTPGIYFFSLYPSIITSMHVISFYTDGYTQIEMLSAEIIINEALWPINSYQTIIPSVISIKEPAFHNTGIEILE